MSLLPARLEPVRPALLTRVVPVTRVVVGLCWLAAAVATLDPVVSLRLLVAGGVALVFWSGLPLARIPRRLLPIWAGVASLMLISILLSSANGDQAAPVAIAAGPVRIAWPAIWAGAALGLRLVVIAVTTLLVFSTSDPTRLADSLVQQWHVPDRFAYGTLGALRVAPLLAADTQAIGAARRLRGLTGGGPVARLRGFFATLLVLLVSAIRRAERMALAMDARGFDSGTRRSHFRELRAGWRDAVVLGGGSAVAALALFYGR